LLNTDISTTAIITHRMMFLARSFKAFTSCALLARLSAHVG
jgi:hypothetical protein